MTNVFVDIICLPSLIYITFQQGYYRDGEIGTRESESACPLCHLRAHKRPQPLVLRLCPQHHAGQVGWRSALQGEAASQREAACRAEGRIHLPTAPWLRGHFGEPISLASARGIPPWKTCPYRPTALSESTQATVIGVNWPFFSVRAAR